MHGMGDARPDEIDRGIETLTASIMLCDSAQVHQNKLYLMGGDWDRYISQDGNLSCDIAIRLRCPWNRTNERVKIRCVLDDEDGHRVKIGPESDAKAVEVEVEAELGRPPGAKRGRRFLMPIVMNIRNLPIEAGLYAWVLELDGEQIDRAPFEILAPSL